MRSDKLNSNSGSYGKFDFVTYSKDMAFANEKWQDLVKNGTLTSLDVSDATVDANITLVKNYEYVSAWDSDGATALTMPAAEEGVFIAWVQEAQADGATALVATCAGNDTYEPYQNVKFGTGIPAQQDSSVAGDTILTLTCSATNGGWGVIGSYILWYCKNDGEWLVKVNGISLGTGATSTIAFSS